MKLSEKFLKYVSVEICKKKSDFWKIYSVLPPQVHHIWSFSIANNTIIKIDHAVINFPLYFDFALSIMDNPEFLDLNKLLSDRDDVPLIGQTIAQSSTSHLTGSAILHRTIINKIRRVLRSMLRRVYRYISSQKWDAEYFQYLLMG